jgi:hypothetical protein
VAEPEPREDHDPQRRRGWGPGIHDHDDGARATPGGVGCLPVRRGERSVDFFSSESKEDECVRVEVHGPRVRVLYSAFYKPEPGGTVPCAS